MKGFVKHLAQFLEPGGSQHTVAKTLPNKKFAATTLPPPAPHPCSHSGTVLRATLFLTIMPSIKEPEFYFFVCSASGSMQILVSANLARAFFRLFNEHLLRPNYISVTSHSSVNKAGHSVHSSWACILLISSALCPGGSQNQPDEIGQQGLGEHGRACSIFYLSRDRRAMSV